MSSKQKRFVDDNTKNVSSVLEAPPPIWYNRLQKIASVQQPVCWVALAYQGSLAVLEAFPTATGFSTPDRYAQTGIPVRGMYCLLATFLNMFFGQIASQRAARLGALERREEWSRQSRYSCADEGIHAADRAMENTKEQLVLVFLVSVLVNASDYGSAAASALMAAWSAFRAPFCPLFRRGLHLFSTLPGYSILLTSLCLAVSGLR